VSGPRLAVGIAVLAAAVTGLFVVYAMSGADLCVWCRVLGR
jgi:hypothetical protein